MVCSLPVDVRDQPRQTQLTLVTAGTLITRLALVRLTSSLLLLQQVEQQLWLLVRVLERPRQQQTGAVECEQQQTRLEEARRAALVEQSQQRLSHVQHTGGGVG